MKNVKATLKVCSESIHITKKYVNVCLNKKITNIFESLIS